MEKQVVYYLGAQLRRGRGGGVGGGGVRKKKTKPMHPSLTPHVLFKLTALIPGGVCKCVCVHVCDYTWDQPLFIGTVSTDKTSH